MNKQYFTKYLPVEGEIQEKDKAFARKDTGHIYYFDKLEPVSKQIATHANKYGLQRLKLFLCSRDIQVGDNITRDGITFEKMSEFAKYITEYTPLYDSWFKVIGEISPAAIWCREGDEFTEGEVKLYQECCLKDGESNEYMKPNKWYLCNDFDEIDCWVMYDYPYPESDGGYVSINKLQFKTFAKIICPTCKQFH